MSKTFFDSKLIKQLLFKKNILIKKLLKPKNFYNHRQFEILINFL